MNDGIIKHAMDLLRHSHTLFEASWFGVSWGADVCHSQPHVETPVGATCVHCEEKIRENDSGYVYANGPVAHRECILRQITGNVAHQLKQCSCFVPGSTASDPPGMTRRQAAVYAVKFYRRVQELEETPDLYDVARDTCFEFGLPWTDPRTGITYEPPK